MYSLWAYAHETWTNYPLPPRGSDDEKVRALAWRDHLGDLPGDLVRRALNRPALARRDFFPPLGLIRTEVLRLMGAAAPDVDEAWAEVQRAVRGQGRYADAVDTSHPAVAQTIQAVGWVALCESDPGDAALFRRFRDFYALAVDRCEVAAHPAPALAPAEAPHELEGGQ